MKKEYYFPFFEKALSESQLRHIGLTLGNSHTNKYNENYSDEFWLQKSRIINVFYSLK